MASDAWQPISTAPRDGMWLGGWWFNKRWVQAVCKRRSDGKIIAYPGFHRHDPEAWQPLPAPPKEDGA